MRIAEFRRPREGQQVVVENPGFPSAHLAGMMPLGKSPNWKQKQRCEEKYLNNVFSHNSAKTKLCPCNCDEAAAVAGFHLATLSHGCRFSPLNSTGTAHHRNRENDRCYPHAMEFRATSFILLWVCGTALAQSPQAHRKQLLAIGEEKGYRHEAVSHALATIERLGR